MHIGKWAALLSVFWLFLSGYIQPLLLSFGVISVLLVLLVVKRMDGVDKEPQHLGLGHKRLRYAVWLLGQIFSSALHVTKLVWGSERLSPVIAKITVDSIPHNKRVLYANSITLTPGTLSVDLAEGQITVHALQESSIEDLNQGEMARKISGIWGDQND